jgi:hypothetical protein
LGQLRGIDFCVAKGTLSQTAKVKIPVNKFAGQGIVVFTLYNKNIQPVAERLVYVHPQKKLYVTAEPDKESYEIRQKATVKIKVTDEHGNPVTTHLGISVSDQLYNNTDDPDNILTHCYLSSQIRGKIYDSAYYFNEENTDRMEALDLLLLTQGWRRYVWQSNNLSPHGQFVITDEITGVQTIKDKKFKNQEQFIQIFNPDEKTQLAGTDSAGRFAIDTETMNALRGGYLYLKPLLSEEYKPTINIDNVRLW